MKHNSQVLDSSERATGMSTLKVDMILVLFFNFLPVLFPGAINLVISDRWFPTSTRKDFKSMSSSHMNGGSKQFTCFRRELNEAPSHLNTSFSHNLNLMLILSNLCRSVSFFCQTFIRKTPAAVC